MTRERSTEPVRVRAKAIGFDHVSVTTSDLDASIAFYAGLLGLPLTATGEAEEEELARMMDQEGVRLRFADIDLGSGAVLELIQFLHPEGIPVTKALWDPGATHIGLQVDDIGLVHDRLVEAGTRVISGPVRWTGQDTWFGAQVLYAVDPDGTWIELVQRPEPVSVVHASAEEDGAIEITEGA